MNISFLNSLTFMNLLEDILDLVEASNIQIAKKFYASVIVRSLPICICSLNEKLLQDLRKFIDLLENHVQNDPLFTYLKNLVSKGKIVNFSSMGRLGETFSGLHQFNAKIKLRIEQNL